MANVPPIGNTICRDAEGNIVPCPDSDPVPLAEIDRGGLDDSNRVIQSRPAPPGPGDKQMMQGTLAIGFGFAAFGIAGYGILLGNVIGPLLVLVIAVGVTAFGFSWRQQGATKNAAARGQPWDP